jgi:hypothetical protein
MSKKYIASSRCIHAGRPFLKLIAWVSSAHSEPILRAANLLAAFALMGLHTANQARTRTWQPLLLALLMALLAAASHANGNASVDKHGFIIFDTADFLQSSSLAPPPQDANWSPVALPDSWRQQKRNWKQYGWYRLSFEHRGSNHDGIVAHQRAIYIFAHHK